MSTFVSRAGEKLEHALDVFKINVEGLIVADFGLVFSLRLKPFKNTPPFLDSEF